VSVNPDGIPGYLKERPQWVVWRYDERDGKPTKVLYSSSSFERASSTDLMTWGTFDDALAATLVGNFAGIGFVFCSADPFVGIDFDKCRNPDTGEITANVSSFLERLSKKAYLEVSPSGTGLHVITRGKFKGGKRRDKVEMYGQDHFFTITGVSPNA
jgi:primase-polymerase (primpol)-like protein